MSQVDQSDQTLYQKINGRFVPVGVRTEIFDMLPHGDWLVSTYPSGQSCRQAIDPDTIALQAAARVLIDELTTELVKASHIKPPSKKLTRCQHQAWQQLIDAMGDNKFYLCWPSMQEIAQTAVDKFVQQTHAHSNHPTVRPLIQKLEGALVMIGESRD